MFDDAPIGQLNRVIFNRQPLAKINHLFARQRFPRLQGQNPFTAENAEVKFYFFLRVLGG